jgi:hypothetical protein
MGRDYYFYMGFCLGFLLAALDSHSERIPTYVIVGGAAAVGFSLVLHLIVLVGTRMDR